MSFHDPLFLTLVYLAAMVVSVPLARKAGLGMVLGYLLAGIALGPSALGLLGSDQEEMLHFTEFGIIMMLFLIGLELQPRVLWQLRGPLFGLGGMQVGLTTAAIAGLGLALGHSWQASLAAGMILSLSSTAIVLQSLQERGALKTTGGETAFAVLLFQDVAVIPMLAVLPLLGSAIGFGHSESRAAGPLLILGAVALVVVAGRYLSRPLFKIVASARIRELFTATALLLVVAVTWLMNSVGLSPALGAFLGGVVLAENEYRHEIETDIEPFKGLLLAAFFISVGAGIDFSAIGRAPVFILLGVATLVGLKWALLFAIGRLGRLPRPDRLLFAFALAQGGEFAFVLLGFSKQLGVFAPELAQQLTAIVAMSMVVAPFLIQVYFSRIEPRFAAGREERDADEIEPSERENPVIIAGFGRFGQMVTRLLKAKGFRATVLDYDAEQIEIIRRFGSKAFYGDASRMDLLRAAGAAQARLLIVAIDDRDKTLEIVEQARKEFPHLRILSRAYDRIHAYELIHLGIEHPYIETAGSALNLGVQALRALGVPARQAYHSAQVFNRHNDESIRKLAKVYQETDEATFIAQARTYLSALEGVLKSDTNGVKSEADRAWEPAPRPTDRRQPDPGLT
jgi:monovalent cation:proton antiporter-2 (CPA2) family protein